MSLLKARRTAEEAATAARAQGDEAAALLAEAVAELAKSIGSELRDLEAMLQRLKK